MRKLDFGSNDTACGAVISACLGPGSVLRELDLESVPWMGPGAVRSLAHCIGVNDKLEVLDLISRIQLDAEEAGAESCWAELFTALGDNDNTSVQVLRLNGRALTAEDGQALARALGQLPAGLLRVLELNGNVLEDDACSAIVAAVCLRPASALRELDLGHASVGRAARLTLTGALRANHALEDLNLDEGADESHALEDLKLDEGADESDESESSWLELFAALEVSCGLQTHIIAYCGLGPRDVEGLAAALRTNRTLRDLLVADENLGKNCGLVLAAGLATNTTLRWLRVTNRRSSLGDTSVFAFLSLLHTNCTLRGLWRPGSSNGPARTSPP